MSTWSPIATPSASKTFGNRFPVRLVVEKQKQILIATVFLIASRNAPKTAKSRCRVCVSGYEVVDMDFDNDND
jgi:hypothetical protein